MNKFVILFLFALIYQVCGMPQNSGPCLQVDESDNNGIMFPPNCEQPQQENMPENNNNNLPPDSNLNETNTMEPKRTNITVIHIHVIDNSEESKSSDSSSSSSESKSDERPSDCDQGLMGSNPPKSGGGCKPNPPAEPNKNETGVDMPKRIAKREPIGPVSLSVSLERIHNLSSDSDSSESLEFKFTNKCKGYPCLGRRKRDLFQRKNLF